MVYAVSFPLYPSLNRTHIGLGLVRAEGEHHGSSSPQGKETELIRRRREIFA
jgi:hypothetical protein